MNDTPGPNIALMKWIVIILGILIVAFTTVIGFKIYKEMTKSPVATANNAITSAPSEGRSTDITASFADLEIALPAGGKILQMAGGQERLFLHVGSKAAVTEILVVDVKNGQLVGRIKLIPGP